MRSLRSIWLAGLVGWCLLCGAYAQSQPEEIAPGENLVVQGVPRIPSSIAEQVGRYTEYRQAAFRSWNPVRREMLIITRFGDTYQVHRVSQPGGARTQLTFFPDNIYMGVHYEPVHGESFIFAKDTGGSEFYQIYRYDLRDGKITLLTDGKSRNTGPLWSYQGNRVAYASTRRNGKDVDIWAVDPFHPENNRMLSQLEGGGWEVTDWSPDGSKLLARDEISAAESYIWLIDASNGQKTLLTPKYGADTVEYGPAKFAKDGKGVYLTTDRDSEFQRLAYYHLGTKQYKFLSTNIPWDIDSFDLSQDGNLVAFVANQDGISTLHLLELKTGQERPIPKLPSGAIGSLRFHRNSRDLAFSLNTSRAPGDAYSIEVNSGKLDRWTYSEAGGLDTSSFSEPQLIHWKSFDGKSISAFLYRPPAHFSGKRPVVIEIHGGPEGQWQPEYLGEENYVINDLGIALIAPNVRGSTGYGKSFQKMDNGFLREGTYKDIGTLLQWVKSQPDLDGDRIMITGGSYGGHMTLATSYLYNDLIRCSVDVVGMSNLVTFLEHTSPYRQDLRRVEYGDERDPKMREFLERIAPMNNADKFRKPMFVVAGYNDPRVPYTEAEQLVEKIKSNGAPVWFLMAKDEGHGFGKKKNRDFQFYATVQFMKEYLLK